MSAPDARHGEALLAPIRRACPIDNPDLIEARAVIAALQTALDRAQARIREAERTIGELNLRLTVQTERVDDAEFKLMVMLASAPARLDATLPLADITLA